MPWTHFLPLAAGGSGVTPFFGMLAMVLVLAVFVSLALVKLRQSLLVGYFLCGVLIANSGVLALVGLGPNDPTIGNLGELGVILLMFTLGLEFSFEEFRHLWRQALFGGGLQVALTAGMPAEALISTGERTLLDYLTEPIRLSFRRALRES